MDTSGVDNTRRLYSTFCKLIFFPQTPVNKMTRTNMKNLDIVSMKQFKKRVSVSRKEGATKNIIRARRVSLTAAIN